MSPEDRSPWKGCFLFVVMLMSLFASQYLLADLAIEALSFEVSK